MKRYKRIALLIFIFAVCLMVYAGEQWLSIDKVYQEANDAYADYSQIVRRLPAYGATDAPRNGNAETGDARQYEMYVDDSAAASDTGQDIINPAITPTPSLRADEGNIAGVTQAQSAFPPEPPRETAPSQDNTATQGNDIQNYNPQGGDTYYAQSASPAPARENARATPKPAPADQAAITAPEMTRPTAPPAQQASPTPQFTPDPNSPIDFNALKAINNDAVAWLYSPNTPIDYPVMRVSDYSYYLDRLPDGRKNDNGSLFIDYNTPSDFSGALTVIYGHNMKSGKMFGSLPNYKSQSYYNQHPFMYLYTERKSYRLDLIYGCPIAEGQWRERSFMYAENVASLISYASHYTTFNSSTSYHSGDKVVVLSTCTFEFNDARYIVLGVLRGI